MDYITHGNYCGRSWSNGQWQDNVCGDLPPTDQFDSYCKEHDCCLHKAGPDVVKQKLCNDKFFDQNFGQSTIQTAASLAVRFGQRPARIVSEFLDDPMASFGLGGEPKWDLSDKGPFDTKNFQGTWWNYEDLKGNCRADMEGRYMKSSNQKRKRRGWTAERSVKRKVNLRKKPKAYKPKAKRQLFKDPESQRRRAFAQLPREWRVAHANYLRAKLRLRRGVYRRERIKKARTLSGMFARGRASNRIKRWWNYQRRRWRHYPNNALVHANQSRINRHNLRRRHAKFTGKYRRQYLTPYKW